MWDRVVVILRGLGVLLVLALALAGPSVSQAATLTVNTTSDPPGLGCTGNTCSLRQAITASASGDTIDFAPGVTGAITLTSGPLSITHGLTITGPGAGTITISGNGTSTVFDIAPSGSSQAVTISGLTITGGSATTNGGGILANGAVSTLTLSGDAITANQVTLTSTTGGGGAGVYINGGTLIVNSSTITGNRVTLGGNGGTTDGGGGIYSNGGNVTVSTSNVSNNKVVDNATSAAGFDGGGGIYSNGGNVTVSTSDVSNNTVVDSATSASGFYGGGGIYSNGGTVSLAGSSVNANTFTLQNAAGGDNGGGGVYSNGGDVAVATSSVDGNSLSVTDSSTSGNDGGGGLYSDGGAIVAIFASISQNSATVNASGNDNGGGGAFDAGSVNTYLTSTVSGNSLTLSGSGTQRNGGAAIRSLDGGLISNSTIAGNAGGAGVFLDSTSGTFQLKDTIVAGNAPSNCGGGTFQSAGFNLESTNTCSLKAAGDLVNTDPQLGPLQNNGGPTATQALAASSPAVDAGTCTDIFGNALTTDQRGVTRPQPAGGKCDIGAFELVPGLAPIPPAAVPGQPAAISSTVAGFSGTVNPEGQATTVFFQYGIDSRYRPGGGTAVIYDQSTPPQTLPADTAPHAVSGSASGLIPHALYHVRLVARNASGTTFGPDQTFTTPPGPAPPAPVVGRNVNVTPVSGQLFVLVGTTLVPLTELTRLPSGTIVDALAGSLQLTAAEPRHKREKGVFGGAIFRLTQNRAGLTTLSVVESAFPGAPSYRTCRPPRATDASVAALSSRTLQLLHASAHGRFRTSGRYSAATVRGTKWTIADRCDGTLTHDLTDSVAVTDFVLHKTVILHAGQSYLARAPRRK